MTAVHHSKPHGASFAAHRPMFKVKQSHLIGKKLIKFNRVVPVKYLSIAHSKKPSPCALQAQHELIEREILAHREKLQRTVDIVHRNVATHINELLRVDFTHFTYEEAGMKSPEPSQCTMCLKSLVGGHDVGDHPSTTLEPLVWLGCRQKKIANVMYQVPKIVGCNRCYAEHAAMFFCLGCLAHHNFISNLQSLRRKMVDEDNAAAFAELDAENERVNKALNLC